MDVNNAKAVLEGIANQTPSLQVLLNEMYQLYEKRYWHQLTISLADLCNRAVSLSADEQRSVILILQNFVAPFVWERINPVDFSNMLNSASKAISSLEERIVFIEQSMQTTLLAAKTPNQQAILNCTCYTVRLRLHLKGGDEKKIRASLQQCKESADSIWDALNSDVKSHFLLLCCEYDRFTKNYNSFYRTCLNYLGSISLDSLSKEQAGEYAHDLAIAALLGSKLYNFGEILLHPVMELLKDGNNAPLFSLLHAFNQGNIAKFESLTSYLMNHSVLRENVAQLKAKLCHMTLLELVFQAIASNSKQLSFSKISQATGVPLAELEYLLMQAMSFGIIQGSIDQISETLNVTNVQPRVFSETEQIRSMAHSVQFLGEKVANARLITAQEAAEFVPSLRAK